MRRRDLMVLFGGTAVLHPLCKASAQSRKPVIGILGLTSPDMPGTNLPIDGLRELGYRDGESVVIESRFAHGDITRYPRLARELVERSPAVIVAPCGHGLRAIREVSRTVPVVAMCADEKNFLGEVASFSRPGGYTTGVTFLAPESIGKRLELLKYVVPGLSRLAVLYEPDIPMDSQWRELERLRPVLGLSYQRLPVTRAEELEAAFDILARERVQALYVFPTELMFQERVRIAELARAHRIASAFEFATQVDAGGLLFYGASITDWLGRSVPQLVDKILKGAKPAELPILQPTRFELVVNLRTARAIGLEIPPSLLIRADRVIE